MLDGKRVLVTGAAQGMGREIAIEAARQGAEYVTVADRNLEGAESAAHEIEKLGAKSQAIEIDLRDSDAIKAMIESAVSGGGGLDTLVNNAGVMEGAFTQDIGFEDLPESVWDDVYSINVKAVWLATRAAAPHLRIGRGPSVVNAASVAGMVGYVSTAYPSSKAAVIQLTRTSAIALSPEIRCNAFCPGSIATPMSEAFLENHPDPEMQLQRMTGAHLIPRFGTSSEVAKVATFLASDDASFLTGVILPVDGGTTAWRGLRSS